MGTFAKGQVVLFPFPYTDLTNRKLRPCLVVSDPMGDDVILCQITSKFIHADHFSIELKRTDTIGGSLQIDSYIRSNMLFTADCAQIVRKLCDIKPEIYDSVFQAITRIIHR